MTTRVVPRACWASSRSPRWLDLQWYCDGHSLWRVTTFRHVTVIDLSPPLLMGLRIVGINGELHHLETGDALLLDPKLPHSYHNPETEPAISLWVMSPPGY